MLENIKLILGINDNEYDNLILLYLNKVETVVVDYCNVSEFNPALESFVEDKVVSIVKNLIESNKNIGQIKSIQRGDTNITYNVVDATTSMSATLTDEDKAYLKRYMKARCY